MTRISTHVLDTARGVPAAGIRVELHSGNEVLGSASTDSDGRINALADARPGLHRLVFTVGPDAPFLRELSVAFDVADTDEHLHIPLLLSPYGVSIYRGS